MNAAKGIFRGICFSGGVGALLRLVFRRQDISILRQRPLANPLEAHSATVLDILDRRQTGRERGPKFVSVSGQLRSIHSHLSSSDNPLLRFYLVGFLQGFGGQICPDFWTKLSGSQGQKCPHRISTSLVHEPLVLWRAR